MPTTRTTRKSAPRSQYEAEAPPFRVRRSSIHGRGVFATRPIRRGRRIIEYVGERVSHAEADRRYEDKASDDAHTFLFTVDAKTVVDAGAGGNAARFINHSCAPNCEAVVTGGRIWIKSVRDIEPGEELHYDYRIGREQDDPPDADRIFRCCCGSGRCRGTMLVGRRPRRRR